MKQKNLKKYEQLPLIDEFDPDEIPWFAEIANRLKKMAEIAQIPFLKPRNGTIALVIHGKPINLNVELCDGLKDGYIKLSIKELRCTALGGLSMLIKEFGTNKVGD